MAKWLVLLCSELAALKDATMSLRVRSLWRGGEARRSGARVCGCVCGGRRAALERIRGSVVRREM